MCNLETELKNVPGNDILRECYSDAVTLFKEMTHLCYPP